MSDESEDTREWRVRFVMQDGSDIHIWNVNTYNVERYDKLIRMNEPFNISLTDDKGRKDGVRYTVNPDFVVYMRAEMQESEST